MVLRHKFHCIYQHCKIIKVTRATAETCKATVVLILLGSVHESYDCSLEYVEFIMMYNGCHGYINGIVYKQKYYNAWWPEKGQRFKTLLLCNTYMLICCLSICTALAR